MASGTRVGEVGTEARELLRSQLQSRGVMLFVTLASIGDAVITTDNNGEVTFLNPVAEKLTGWNLADAIGNNIEDVFRLIDEFSSATLPNPARQALESGFKVELPANAMLVRKDGSQVPVEDSGSPIQGIQDEILGVILVFRDVSERKKAEAIIRHQSQLDRTVARISTAFATTQLSEVDRVINEALEEVGRFLNSTRTQVYIFHKSASTMVCTHEWHADGVTPFLGTALPTSLTPYWIDQINKRQPVRVAGLQDIPAAAHAEQKLWHKRDLRSLLAVPMSQADRVLGFICVENSEEKGPWSEDILNMLSMVGNVFASAMARRNAENKLEAARAREVEIGSRIQQTLLLSTPPLNSIDFRIATLTIPSLGIDGDFYDFLLHPNRCLDIIMGDVMGKGVPAALISAGAKTEFLRSMSHLLVSSPRGSIPEPRDIVNDVHSVLTPQLMKLDSFATLSYLRLDPIINKVTLVDCGNTRLMRCSWDSGNIDYLAGFNVPLGFMETEVYAEAQLDYAPGDLFMLYSDGVTEARNPKGELFGLERLEGIVSLNHKRAPEYIVEAVKDAVTNFMVSTVLSDDLTCVVIRVVSDLTEAQPPQTDELHISSDLGQLYTIRAFFRNFCTGMRCIKLTDHELNLLALALNEVASNIIRHAYHGRADEAIHIRIDEASGTLRVRLTHDGEAFTGADLVPVPSLDDSKEGGLGLFIIDRSLDVVEYGQDPDGRQFIELIKHFNV